MWTAAILAGGRARRLGGRAKGTLHVGDRPILERQLEVLRPLASEVLLVANDPAAYGGFGVPVVPDLIPGAGPLGGLYTAISAARHPCTLVVACDMPFLTAPFLDRLVTAATRPDVDAAVPHPVDGWQPLCAAYTRRSADAIRRQITAGNLKVIDVLAALRVHAIGPAEIARYDPDGILFFNVNTPDDYRRALELMARG